MEKIEKIKDKIIVVLVFIITIILTALLLTSCQEQEKNKENYVDGFHVVVVDSCEYLVRPYYRGGIMGHKGNCRFCIERNKKLIKEQLDSTLIEIFD